MGQYLIFLGRSDLKGLAHQYLLSIT